MRAAGDAFAHLHQQVLEGGGIAVLPAHAHVKAARAVVSLLALIAIHGGEPGRGPLARAMRLPQGLIRTIEGPNDYGSLQEVLYRRFKRALQGDPSFSKMPDFILMDGGKPQVSAAEQVLAAMKIDIPVAGMVKDDKHRTRGLLYKDKELELKSNPVLFRYVTSVQDEVHRFAIDYHHGLRKKTLQKSALDDIEGIGEKRRNALLTHFGSIDKIKEATLEELCQVQGITKPAAEKVMEWASKK